MEDRPVRTRSQSSFKNGFVSYKHVASNQATMEHLKNIVASMPLHILMDEYNKLRAKIVKPTCDNAEYADLCKYYAVIGARVREVMTAFDEIC